MQWNSGWSRLLSILRTQLHSCWIKVVGGKSEGRFECDGEFVCRSTTTRKTENESKLLSFILSPPPPQQTHSWTLPLSPSLAMLNTPSLSSLSLLALRIFSSPHGAHLLGEVLVCELCDCTCELLLLLGGTSRRCKRRESSRRKTTLTRMLTP